MCSSEYDVVGSYTCSMVRLQRFVMHRTGPANMGLVLFTVTIIAFPCLVQNKAYSSLAVVCLRMIQSVDVLYGSETFLSCSQFSYPDHIPYQPGFHKFFSRFIFLYMFVSQQSSDVVGRYLQSTYHLSAALFDPDVLSTLCAQSQLNKAASLVMNICVNACIHIVMRTSCTNFNEGTVYCISQSIYTDIHVNKDGRNCILGVQTLAAQIMMYDKTADYLKRYVFIQRCIQ